MGMRLVWTRLALSAAVAFAFWIALSVIAGTAAQAPPVPPPPSIGEAHAPGVADRAEAGPAFDVEAATDAWLAKVPSDQRARSDAYFEGGYWLQLWEYLYGAAVAVLLLATRWSGRMRDRAVRLSRVPSVQAAAYWTQYVVLASLLAFPLTVYSGFVREHRYGLSTQTFGAWLGDQGKALLLSVVLGAVLVAALFAAVRRASDRWWIWGALVSVAFVAFTALIGPVFIAPVFNTYTKLQDPRIREPILRMARANGIAATEVYQVDASRQTTRVSANVSGFLGTERITLNDNLIDRASLPEVEAVMGHEMGHYVLNHVYKSLLFFGLVIVLAFLWLRRSLDWSLRRFGERWDLHGVSDLAVLPLAVLLIATFAFVLAPVLNTHIRTQEYEADLYAINASRQPDGWAEVVLKLGEYRKLDPGSLEEWLFYDHPSGRTRIMAAMRWKAENVRGDVGRPPTGASRDGR
jgi:STE24 endopeptidase